MTRSPMRLAFFGSSLLSAYWNGAATYYRGLIRALAQHGHHVSFYEPDAYDRQNHRDIPMPDWARVIVYPGDDDAAALRQLERAAAHANVLIKTSGIGVYDQLLERALLEHRRPGQLAIFWDVDAPATLERLHNNPHDPLRALIPQYDLILTYGGGPTVVHAYQQLGARACVPIYNALDPTSHYPVQRQPRFASDLTFMGNRLPDREQRVEQFLLTPAEQLPQHRFLLAGNGWHDKPLPANVRCLGHAYTCDHNAINCSARFVLNINRTSMARCGHSPATRLFEAAGAAACIISDTWPGLDDFLIPDKHILLAEHPEHVTRHLTDTPRRDALRIGRAARQHLLKHHTYRHRAEHLLNVLEHGPPQHTRSITALS